MPAQLFRSTARLFPRPFCRSPLPLLLRPPARQRALHVARPFSPAEVAHGLLASQAVRPLQTTARRAGTLKPFVLADIGEGITECEIVKWLVTPGDKVEEFDPLVEVMSDKASVEITSPFSGTVDSLNGNVGDMLKVGSTLCSISVEGGEVGDAQAGESPTPVEEEKPPAVSRPPPSPIPSPSQAPPDSSSVLATPATRRFARELDVDLSQVEGTGKDGRITKEDVLAFSRAPPSISAASSATSAPSPSIPQPAQTATTASIPFSPTRRAMFRSLTHSLQIPHFAYSETLDVTELERLRVRLSSQIPPRYRRSLTPGEEAELARRAVWGGEEGTRVAESRRIDRVTLMPLLVKALSMAMDENPLFFCTLSPPPSSASTEEPALTRRDSHDISVALSSPSPSGGLFTPVLRAVEHSSIFSLASQLSFLQSLLTTSSSSAPAFPKEHQGAGTLTLSNIGVVGGRTTHPVVPPTGQLAIGAVGRVRVEPRFSPGAEEERAKRVAGGREEDGGSGWKIEPRLVLDATFAADHRVVEGVELARLVASWKRIIENPSRLLA
ncbi:hypothetical protein JCM10213_003311 [Rhodosporidiobolus nylandii]